MDLLTLFPYLFAGVAVFGVIVIAYEKFRKEEHPDDTLARLRANGVGSPEDRANYLVQQQRQNSIIVDDEGPGILDVALTVAELELMQGASDSPTQEPWQGDGGSFSGAGASGSFDDSPSGSDDSSSSDSSSSDSSSSDSYDSGSSDSGSSDSF